MNVSAFLKPTMLAIAVLATFQLAGMEVTTAQDSPAQPADAQLKTLRAYRLQFASAEATYQSILQLLPEDANASADIRTNALIVRASNESHDFIANLIEAIDVPGPGHSDVSIVSVGSEPDDGLIGAIELMAGEVDFSIDRQRGLLLLRGEKQDVENVTNMIEALTDMTTAREPEPEAPASPAQTLRIVWLQAVKELPAETELSPELAAAIKPLQAMGFNNLSQKGQIIVNAGMSGDQFATRSSLHQEDGNREFTVEGRVQDESVQINISADSVEIMATVAIKPGQWIILGAAGNGAIDDVFALQVLNN